MNRAQPNVFSTAFVDLFACGLGGAIVLWLINISDFKLPSVPQPSFINISLGVYGWNHLKIKPTILQCGQFPDVGKEICSIGETELMLINMSADSDDENDKSGYVQLYQIHSDNIKNAFEITFYVSRCDAGDYHNFEYFVSTPKSSIFQEVLFHNELTSTNSKKLGNSSFLMKTLEAHSPGDPFSSLRIDDGNTKIAKWSVRVHADGKVESIAIPNEVIGTKRQTIIDDILKGI